MLCVRERMTANIRIHLPNGEIRQTVVTPQSTLQEILNAINFDLTGEYGCINEGGTLMPTLTWNLVQYNHWYIEAGFVSPIRIVNMCNIHE
jgi:hypothetical protein